jgi:leucyl-tRNA synthetase
VVPEAKENLPIELPYDVSFDIPGNPLDRHPTWRDCTCPKCGAKARRETDTMDTFVDSSWYFARFTAPRATTPTVIEDADYWMNVDQYIGGIEHAILHCCIRASSPGRCTRPATCRRRRSSRSMRCSRKGW